MKSTLMIVASLLCLACAVWASGVTSDGKYVAHGTAATITFEGGLHSLDPLYTRGISPSKEILDAGIDKQSIPKATRGELYGSMRKILSKKYVPTPDAVVKGLKRVYDGHDAVVLMDTIDPGVSVELTRTTTVFTVKCTSSGTYKREPRDLTQQGVLAELGDLLDIPEKQFVKGKVEMSLHDIDGTPVISGIATFPSPDDASKDLMGFRWYNTIRFWTTKGTLFVSVVPFEGAVARPSEISFEGK